MHITIGRQDTLVAGDLLVIACAKDAATLPPYARGFDKALAGALSDMLKQEEFKGKEGEVQVLRTRGGLPVTKVALLGTGAVKMRPAELRRFGALAMRAARTHKARKVALMAGDLTREGAQALAEGCMLGDYAFHKYQAEKLKEYAKHAITDVTVLVSGGRTAQRVAEVGIARGVLYAQGTMFARGLVNEPASVVTPSHLVRTAEAIAASDPKRIKCKVFDRAALETMGAGGILAVGKGSAEPPYLIHLTYKPAQASKKRVAVVGKGITFDSGGLSIKPSTAMEDMKIDMAGAAAVLGAFSVIAKLAPRAEVHGIAAVCENMPSGSAARPGDIVHTMQGKTIEILNTDAEGRVTLADSLHYAVKLKPDSIVDLATLTGACMVALGQEVAGLMSNDDKVSRRLLEAADESGELLWRLPLPKEYKETIKSKVADLRNIATVGYGGALTAGLFLEEFVGTTPWAHLDIAGPAWAERSTVPHQPVGATGFGVRTVLRYLEKS